MLIFNSIDINERSGIYATNDDGSDLRCLSFSYRLFMCQSLKLSPDRSRLLFRAQPPKDTVVRWFVLDLDQASLRMLRQEPYPGTVRWLTDEKLICVAIEHLGTPNVRQKVWTVSVEGQVAQKTLNLGDYVIIDVSPDGDKLALAQGYRIPHLGLTPVSRGGVFIGILGEDGTVEVVEVARQEDYEKSHSINIPSSWSPDGRTIACIGGYEDEIWLVNVDGSCPRKVIDGDYFWMQYRWSPDATKIAFMRGLDGGGPSAERGALYVTHLDRADEQEVLIRTRGDGPWEWASNSQSIVQLKRIDNVVSLCRTRIDQSLTEAPIKLGSELKNVMELIVT